MSSVFQNPGYMKDNFVIMIESFHIGDVGDQHNVSITQSTSTMQSPVFLHYCFSNL